MDSNVNKKKKEVAGKMKNPRAEKFEKEINRQEKQMKRERAGRVKAGGFKNEHDYFTNVNPFTGKRRGS